MFLEIFVWEEFTMFEFARR